MTIGRYYYDGEGKRVKKVTDTETTVFVYSGGLLIAEYSTNVAPIEEAKVSYTTADHLGSPRVLTNQNAQVSSRRDFMPFGEELYAGVGNRTGDNGLKYGSTDDDVRQKFTGYQKDNETNLDFAEARMYANNFGRFTAVDPLLASGKSSDPQSFNRYLYVMNNPMTFIDPDGLCTVPSGLKQGQVGICFEAFIASPRVGPGGIGHGDGRTFSGNDGSLTARVTVWAIVSTDETSVSVTKISQVSASTAGVQMTGPVGIGLPNTSGERTVSLQGNAVTDAKLTNIQSKVGEKDFGAGVDVTVSIANGTNGVQQLGRDLQTTGAVMGGTSPTTPGQVAGAAVNVAGRIAEAAAPSGTIDGNVSVRITGNGQVTRIGGETRGFPSYAAYAYTVGADGKVVTQKIFERRENKIEDLRKPMTPIP